MKSLIILIFFSEISFPTLLPVIYDEFFVFIITVILDNEENDFIDAFICLKPKEISKRRINDSAYIS